MKRPTLLATGLVLALLAPLAACSDDDPPPSADRSTTASTASTTSSTSTTTTKPSTDGYVKAEVDPSLPRQDIDINLRYPATFTPAQVEVVQAWANYRHVFYVMTDPTDPDSELLDRYATSEVESPVRDRVRKYETDGLVVRITGGASVRETVTRVEIEDNSATAVDCLVDGAAQVRAADGAVVNNEVETVWSRVYFARKAGAWKLAPPRPDSLGSWNGDQEERCIPEP